MSFLEKYWYGNDNSAILNSRMVGAKNFSPFFWLLKGLSFFYYLAILIRKKAYQWGVFKTHSSNIPIIVVGNLTVGGTGKTPLVITLAALLKTAGYHPGIVSRGYGGHSKQYPLMVTDKTNPHESGDEAVLIAQRTQCPVVVAPKRVEAVQYLQKKYPSCNLILSDDGLQHLAMGRNIEIVVIDGQRGFGNGYCLPAGPLREPVERMNNVDFVFFNGSFNDDGKSPLAPSCSLKNETFEERYLSTKEEEAFGGAPPLYKGGSSLEKRAGDFKFHIQPECFIEMFNEEKALPLNSFSGQTIHAVMGIGNPQRFLKTLTDLNIQYEAHIFSDHHEFAENDFIFNNENPIIMTEKDAVKCREMTINNKNLYYLKVSAIINDEKNSFKDDLLQRIRDIA